MAEVIFGLPATPSGLLSFLPFHESVQIDRVYQPALSEDDGGNCFLSNQRLDE
jgi:hypothetical protein